jgi:hypothetical protein
MSCTMSLLNNVVNFVDFLHVVLHGRVKIVSLSVTENTVKVSFLDIDFKLSTAYCKMKASLAPWQLITYTCMSTVLYSKQRTICHRNFIFSSTPPVAPLSWRKWITSKQF